MANPPRSIRVPFDMVLSARTVAHLAVGFTATELSELIDRLIEQLDAMTPDADLEPDPELSRAR